MKVDTAMVFCLAGLVPVAVGLAEGSCPQQPFQMPIKDVQVLPSVANSYMMGIPSKIGTPSQDIVMLPWLELNNTWVYDHQVSCDRSLIRDRLRCNIRRGDPFEESKSTTFHKTTDIVAAGGASVETGRKGSERGIAKLISTSLAGDETFAAGDKESLSNFPIGIPRLQWDRGFTTLHALGLGSNSTYLNALRKSGKIGSRVFSIFWGRVWDDDPVDGSLVVGGYDEEKTIGANFTAPLVYGDAGDPSACWTGAQVYISDIQLNNLDGSDVSLLPAKTKMPACIVPQRQSLMEVPQPLLNKFERLTKTTSNGTSSGIHYGAPIFSADDAFEGDLTIVLSSGLKVRVPNSQFITPHLRLHRNGTRTASDDWLDLVIGGLDARSETQPKTQPVTLGRYFLTSAYLMVNHDAKAFTLWHANPTTSSSLVAVFDEKTAKRCGGAHGIMQPPMSATGDQGERPSGAVVGGAVAGGIIGIAMLGFGTMFLLRRRRETAGGEPASPDRGVASAEHKPGGQYVRTGSWAQEMAGSTHQVYEMDGQGHHGPRSGDYKR